MGLDTLAQNLVTWHVRDLEGMCHGAMRALAKAGVVGAKVTDMLDGTDLETTGRYRGRGQLTRPVRIEETRGQGHALAGTVDGWNVRLRIDAVTKMLMAVKVGKRGDSHAALPPCPNRWA
jgi:hypothetical protein